MRDRRALWPGLLWVAAALLFLSALLATRAGAQPIIPEAPAGSLGVCDSGNPYPRAKIATEADAGDCNTDTSGAGTEQVLCVCMPDGEGGYSWEPVAAEAGAVSLGDLDDVTTDFAVGGSALIYDGLGASWAPSTNAVCLSTGLNCPADDTGTDDQTAAEVPITDTGAFFAGADVEAALQEVGPTMTDARAPTAHASTHEAGGVDEIAAEDLATSCADGQILEALTGGLVCGTDDTGGDFASITSGTNTAATMVVGSGGSLSGTGGAGSLAATSIDSDGNGDYNVWVSGNKLLLHSFGQAAAATSSMMELQGGSTIVMRNPAYFYNSGVPIILDGADGVTLNKSAELAWTNWSSVPTGEDLRMYRSGASELTIDDHAGGSAKLVISDIFSIAPRASAPASCAYPEIYADTSGAICLCDTGGSWAIWIDTTGGSGNCT